MDYNMLLDLATDLGYEQAMAGAETFRVEESISRVMGAYGVEAEVFAIPNYLVVSMISGDGQPITRMRRIGYHGNDLDTVEKFNDLSRRLCAQTPALEDAKRWLQETRDSRQRYSTRVQYLGNFVGSFGYGLFFGGSWLDGLCAGLCGMVVGFIDTKMNQMRVNYFFRTIASSFFMALLAYCLGALGICANPDAANIGALMLLVPGLLFTNSMRDIIYGDTNSGVTRFVQVVLTAAAIALGTATAWNLASRLWGAPVSCAPIPYSIPAECIFAFIGCIGFVILFNIHGPGGLVCAMGGLLVWAVYRVVLGLEGSDIPAYFWAAIFASAYSETMARIRKFPAISYLVVSIFPIIPGAGVYYTMNYAVQGQTELFASQGMHTAAIAGVMAVGIMLVSTVFRMYSDWKMHRRA